MVQKYILYLIMHVLLIRYHYTLLHRTGSGCPDGRIHVVPSE